MFMPSHLTSDPPSHKSAESTMMNRLRRILLAFRYDSTFCNLSLGKKEWV